MIIIYPFELLCWMIVCHMIGDYVFQSDFIANTKGTNWYHLLVHSVLYCVPFAILFTYIQYPNAWFMILVLLINHVVIDAAKARFHFISYVVDQVLHYIIIISLFIGYLGLPFESWL